MTVPFLSEVSINPLRSGGRDLIASPQRIHAAVEGCLPPQHRGAGRLLWRLEREPHQARLLIQSPDRPTLDHLVEQAGWRDTPAGAPRVADLAPLLGQLAKGRQFAFRTVLNPVSSVRSEAALLQPTSTQRVTLEKGRSVRVAERTAQHQLDWFLARAWTEPRWGFRVAERNDGVPATDLVGRESLSFRRGDSRVSLSTATFEGILVVEDPEILRARIVEGIGKGRAYGCGLLTLAPVV